MTAREDEVAERQAYGDFERDYWRAAPRLSKSLEALRPDDISDSEFCLLADNIPTLCWIANGDGYIVWYNRRWHEYCGTSSVEMEGWGWQSVHDPGLLPEVMERWKASIATGEPFEMTFPLKGADGVFRPFLTRIQPVRDKSGKVVRWFGVNTEITAQAAAEQALRESEARYRMLFEAIDAGFCVIEIEFDDAGRAADYRFVEVNPAFQRHTGLANATGKSMRELAPDLEQYWFDTYGRIATNREPIRFEHHSKALGRWFDVYAYPVGAPEQKRVAILFTDVTTRKEAEEALRESETRFREVFQNAAVGMIEIDADWNILTSNDAYRAITGRSEEDLRGANCLSFTYPDDVAAGEEALRALAAGEASRVTFEKRYLRPNGDIVWVRSNLSRVSGEHSATRFLKVIEDITDQKRAEASLSELTRRLDSILNNTRMAVFMMDSRQHCVFMNKAAEELTGYSLEETQGRPLHDVIHHKYPDGRDYPIEECPIDRAFPEDDQVEGEELFVHKDGHFYPVAFTASPIRDESGRPVGTIIEARNIAEEKARDLALREESEALEILNRTAAQVAAELDLDRLVQTVTDAGVELTGAQFGAFFYNVVDEKGEWYTLYSISGVDRSNFDKFPMPRNTHVFEPTFGGKGVVRSPDITKDPRYGKMAPHYGMPKGHLPVRSYLAVPVVSRSGEVIGGLFFGHKKTDVFSDRSERLMTGLAAQAAIGIDNARLFQAAQRLNQTLEAQVAERTAERDRIWQVSQDLLGVADLDGTWRSVNPAWTRVLGWEASEIIGRTSDWLEHPDDREPTRSELARLAKGGITRAFVNRFRTRSGEYRTLSWTAVPVEDKLYAVARDVTDERTRQAELEQTQERLRQAQKMETVGQLTGGLAHDFNNLLQIVTGNLEILQRNLPDEAARLRRLAENARRGAERAAALTQRLLAFSRRQPLAPKPIDPNKLVAGMSEMLHRTLGETIEVETVLASGLWRVEADPNQLESAILNLAVNARDAMPEGGKLTIETANAHLDRAYAAQNAEITPGQYVAICVSDTGIGMAPETVARVFEPFFTTKDVGKGTGLGLSMVYGFVKQSGGHVKIYSEPGHGTTVKIYLPRLTADEMAEESLADSPVPEGTREETILVCEDDDDVRAYSVEVLRELGYRVLEAHDGPSALRLLERQEGKVDLLFTDVVLPGGMTGAMLAQEAQAARPGLKVLFTTGYARDAIVHHGRLDPGVELITKPFSYSDLGARIRDALDAP